MIITESNEAYHANPAIGSSSVKAAALNSVAHWHGAEFKSSPAMDLGSAVHANYLQPEEFLVKRGPESRRGKAWQDVYEGRGTDVVVLPVGEFHKAEAMAMAMHENPHMAKLWTQDGWEIENSIYVDCPETGLQIKVKADAYNENLGIVMDVKTGQTANPAAWASQYGPFYKFGYHIQCAWYLRTLQLEGIKVDKFYIFAVESTAPNATQCFDISSDTIKHGHAVMMDTLHRIKEAQASGEYLTGWPDWAVL